MSKNKNCLVDEKFNIDNSPITEEMINEESSLPEPLEVPLTPYDERDTYYSQILANYNTEYKDRRKQIKLMRNWLFGIMNFILVGVIVSCIVLFFMIVNRWTGSIENIATIITVAVSFVSTILTIPIIIAKSLFPEKEDNQIVDVLTKLIENDENIRKNNKN